MATREVKVTILGDVRGFERALTAAGVDTQKLGIKLNTTGQQATTFANRVETSGRRVGASLNRLSGIASEFGVPFVSEFAAIGSGFDKLSVKGEGFGNKMAAVGKAAVIGISAAAVAIGVVGVKAALDEEKATARLITAVTNVHEAYANVAPQIDLVSKAMIKLGFDDTSVHSSLAKLIPTVGTTGKALELMGLAANIARGRNIGLEEATALLVKVTTGHVALLGRLGIATKSTAVDQAELTKLQLDAENAQKKLTDVTKKHGAASLEARTASAELGIAQKKVNDLLKDGSGDTISAEEAIKRLSDMYGGAASQHAETFAGKLDTLKAEADQLAEAVGFFLIPIIEKLAQALLDGVTWLENHKTAAIALAGVIGGVLVVAMLAYIATLIEAAALNIAATWEFLAVAAAVAAVSAAVYFLITNWDALRAWFDQNMPVVNFWIDSMVGTTLAAKDAVMWLYNAFRTVLGAVEDVVHAIGRIHIPDLNPLHIDLNPFAEGGMVPGPIGAPLPILAHGGEMVLNQAQQRALLAHAPSVESVAATSGAGINLTQHIYGVQDVEGVGAATVRRLRAAQFLAGH